MPLMLMPNLFVEWPKHVHGWIDVETLLQRRCGTVVDAALLAVNAHS